MSVAVVALGIVLGDLGPAATAAAPSAYQQVLGVYESQGAIPPCRFSGPQLAAAQKGIDTYGEQYFADFTQAIQTALSARAAGACAASPAPAPALAPGGVPRPPAHFGPVTAATDAGVPAPLAVMGGLAAVLALFGLGTAFVRARRLRRQPTPTVRL